MGAWDELAELLERSTAHLSPEEQERVGELYPIENRWIHFLIRTALSPRAIHRIGWASTRRGFPHLRVHVEESSDAHVVARVELPRRYRGSAFFFRGTIGELRTMTELLGIGPSEVDADVSPWHGVYRVRFPSAQTEPDDLRAASRRLVSDGRWSMSSLIGWLFGLAADDASGLAERLQRVQGLDRDEARIVVRLGQGAALRHIAAELGWSVGRLEAHLNARHDRITEAVRVELAARTLDDELPWA